MLIRLLTAAVTEDFGGTPRLVWDGVSAHNADSLLSTLSDEKRNMLQEAEEVLSDILSNGPVEANEVKNVWIVACDRNTFGHR